MTGSFTLTQTQVVALGRPRMSLSTTCCRLRVIIASRLLRTLLISLRIGFIHLPACAWGIQRLAGI
ncbi:MAG: hypothetical protein ACKPKO_45220, partial [Candidatus Fonsibacter sp.]